MKIDFHVHTYNSSDGLSTLEQIAKRAKAKGIDAIAITDHDFQTLNRIEMINSIYFIPGIELSTRYGHILGLNLQDKIDLKYAKEEPVKAIKEAGGYSVLAHPFDLRSRYIKINEIPKVDAIEVINSSSFPFGRNTKFATEFASKLNLAKTAGSDSHWAKTVGNAYVKVNAPSIEEALKQIFIKKNSIVQGRAISMVDKITVELLRLKKRNLLTLKAYKDVKQRLC